MSLSLVYDDYGNYVEGLETDAGKIIEYFGKDFIGLNETIQPAISKFFRESAGESSVSRIDNYML